MRIQTESGIEDRPIVVFDPKFMRLRIWDLFEVRLSDQSFGLGILYEHGTKHSIYRVIEVRLLFIRIFVLFKNKVKADD